MPRSLRIRRDLFEPVRTMGSKCSSMGTLGEDGPAWGKDKFMYLYNRIVKSEGEITALQKALKTVEGRLDSHDMRSSNILDRISAMAMDTQRSIDALKSSLESVQKNQQNLQKSVTANQTGILNVSRRIDVTRKEVEAFAVEKVEVAKSKLQTSIKECFVRNDKLSADLANLSASVKQYKGIHDQFVSEYNQFVKRKSAESEDFRNRLDTNIKDTGLAVNKLNAISADFSNHVGDMRSQVASLKQTDADFTEKFNQHTKVFDKCKADFESHVVLADQRNADFQEHVIDYNLHNVPKEIKEQRAKAAAVGIKKRQTLSVDLNRAASMEPVKLPGMTFFKNIFSKLKPGKTLEGIQKWWGANQYKTPAQGKTWPGGNQYVNRSSGGFTRRYRRLA